MNRKIAESIEFIGLQRFFVFKNVGELLLENARPRRYNSKIWWSIHKRRFNIVENKNRNTAAIGVFDSGVGGISVLRELVAQMPNENYIFFGDSKNAPYGTKTLEEVQKLTCADAEYLLSRGVKALVVACNTATSAAIRILREKYADMPVIGIEPALKPAVHAGGHPRVLVMATPMTLREEKFHALMQRFESDAEILRLPCPGLVE